ncbi:MAG: hypothetical protein HQM14_20140 [SAR324 cluster bacterium]|nr:hypothetical protein [SAR324 cluster bacterium]
MVVEPQMHPLEQKMMEILKSGREPNLTDFGGFNALLDSAASLASTRIMPEFLKLALQKGIASDEQANFICACVESATDDFIWQELVDLLWEASHLPNEINTRCFPLFLECAKNKKLKPVARAAGLDAALRWAINGERTQQLRLITTLLEVYDDDDPVYLARVAKIIGVSYAHWGENDLIAVLRRLVEIDGVADEAAFELGMCMLSNGLTAANRKDGLKAFEAALFWFDKSASCREFRPDARLYYACLRVLVEFSSNRDTSLLIDRVKEIKSESFMFHAWCLPEEAPPWMGSRAIEAHSWEMLALRLEGLAKHLNESSWWDPSLVVEPYLVRTYTASKSFLKQDSAGGVEQLIRPKIEKNLATNRYQYDLLKTWIDRSQGQPWHDEARLLLSKVEASSQNDEINCLTNEEGLIWISESKLPDGVKELIAGALRVQLDNMSHTESTVLGNCIEYATQNADYRECLNGRVLFNAILLWSLRFLSSRLDLTKKDAPAIHYMFEQKDGDLPSEDTIQADFFNFLYTNAMGTEIEVSNIAAGRADVRASYQSEEIVIELKRELKDSSFKALKHSYSAQAVAYQNTGIRLGFLLVLDLTEVRKHGIPHLSDLVQPTMVIRHDETEPRLLMILKVPGRRFYPSALQ